MTSWKDLVRRRAEPRRRALARPNRPGPAPALGALEARRLLNGSPLLAGPTVLPAVAAWSTVLPTLPGPAGLGPLGLGPAPGFGPWHGPGPGPGDSAPIPWGAIGRPPISALPAPAPGGSPGGPAPTPAGTAPAPMSPGGGPRLLALTRMGPPGGDAGGWAASPVSIASAVPTMPVAEPMTGRDVVAPAASGGTTGEAVPRPTGPHDHPILAEAPVAIDGAWSTEVAVADPVGGTVTVLVGNRVVFHQGGLDRPGAVKLADLNDDGVADLLVADSGDDRVLVYPGLASGGFGGGLNAGAGFAVGVDPVDLTVGDLNGDRRPDLLVTNRGSDDVSILLGRGPAASWTLDPSGTIAAGVAPVRTAMATPDGETTPLIAICNSGSNDVFVYRTGPDGRVDDQPSRVFGGLNDPTDVVVGPMARRSEMDMVAVDGDSREMTYFGDILGDRPTRRVIAATGTSTFSILPFASRPTGLTDVLVAGSDGRLAVLQAGPGGVQLTDLATPTGLGLGVVTAIAAGAASDASTLDLYEALGDGDLIAEYQVDLATLLPAASGADAASPGTADGALTWELVPTGGGSMLDLAGVLWNGPSTRAGATTDPAPDQADPAAAKVAGPVPVAGAPTSTTGGDVSPSGAEADAEADRSAEAQVDGWARYVMGLDAAFDSLQAEVAALAPADLDPDTPGRPDAGPIDRLVARAGGPGEDQPDGPVPGLAAADVAPIAPSRAARRRVRVVPGGPDLAPSGAERPSDLVTAAVGSAVAVRLLVNATPPRPPRPRSARRRGAVAPWPELVPPTSPHA